MAKYRIVTDDYLGYAVEVKYLLIPFWIEVRGSNTHKSIENAERWLQMHLEQLNKSREKKKVVKNLGEL